MSLSYIDSGQENSSMVSICQLRHGFKLSVIITTNIYNGEEDNHLVIYPKICLCIGISLLSVKLSLRNL